MDKRPIYSTNEYSEKENDRKRTKLEDTTTLILDDIISNSKFLFEGLKHNIRDGTPEKRIKLILLGDEKIGKSTFVNRFQCKTSVKTIPLSDLVDATVTSVKFYFPLLGLDIWELQPKTDDVVLLDVARELLTIEGCPFMKDADCGLIMFDVTNRLSYKNTPNWWRTFYQHNCDIPLALCGTKVDNIVRKVQPRSITFHRKKNLPYFDVSSIVNHNVLETVTYLIGKVLKKDRSKVESYSMLVPFDSSTMAQQLQQIAKTPSPFGPVYTLEHEEDL